MHPLKLPAYKPKLKEGDRSEILCLVRRKYVSLTPEEWVRQHFLNLLIEHLGYPKGLIKIEHSIRYFKNSKRSDITILDRSGSPYLLVECKSYDVLLNEGVAMQASEYNKVVKARYVAITNGLQHFSWEMKDGKYVALTEFPGYQKA